MLAGPAALTRCPVLPPVPQDADKEIIKHIKDLGRLVDNGAIVHSYPFCWRSDTPLIYRAVPSWFVRVEEIKPQVGAGAAAAAAPRVAGKVCMHVHVHVHVRRLHRCLLLGGVHACVLVCWWTAFCAWLVGPAAGGGQTGWQGTRMLCMARACAVNMCRAAYQSTHGRS